MRKVVLFMHVSLDGFVAGPKGEMDWIKVDDEMFEYAGKMTDQSDTGLYGRVTFEMMEAYWPTAADQPNASKHDIQHSSWYNNVEKVVVSKTMKGQTLPNTRIISENVVEQVQVIKKQPGSTIVIFGSPSTSKVLMKANLIDEYWLFINPVVLGEGVPLFKEAKLNLNLIETVVFKTGVIGMHYTSRTS